MKQQEAKGDKNNLSKPNKKHYYARLQEQLYQIMTGKLKYNSITYTEDHFRPDLILKLDLPTQATIPIAQYVKIQDVLTVPSQLMEKTYQKIKNDILKEMQEHKQSNDPTNLKIRYQHSIQALSSEHKTDSELNQQRIQSKDEKVCQKRILKFVDDLQQTQEAQLQCFNEMNGVLDGFTVIFNSLMYMLQKECGFKVKAFLLQQKIFLFLYNNTQNYLKMANRYQLKKQVPHEFYDFYLNDPFTKDYRPIRFYQQFNASNSLHSKEKYIQRYFQAQGIETAQIVESLDLDNDTMIKYMQYVDLMKQIVDIMKFNVYRLTEDEKAFIYYYNRGKINPGCESIMIKNKQKIEYVRLEEDILNMVGFTHYERPKLFTQFYIPLNRKHCSFFEKLENILMYKPMKIGKSGKLSLFSSMERSKMSYLIIKNKFHIHKMKEIFGAKIYITHDKFQKFGQKMEGVKQGGLDGFNMTDRWYQYAIYTDINTIRNYAGQQVAYIVMYQKYILTYLYLVIIPFLSLYAIELGFGNAIFPITGQVQILFLSITYQIYLHYWQQAEESFIEDYTEGVKSKVFLSGFKGPYRRNPLTDKANQFQEDQGLLVWLKNFITLMVIASLLGIFGGIFHGCKMLLVEIHEQLSIYSYERLYLSMPYIISYSIFFAVQGFFRYFVIRRYILKWLCNFNNPPSDEDYQALLDRYNFMYSVGIELIGPLLLIVIYPTAGNHCYEVFCINELFFYVYSRYIILIAGLLLQLITTLYTYVVNVLKRIKERSGRSKAHNFSSKIQKILKHAIEEQDFPQYQQQTLDVLISLFLTIMYINIISESSLVILITIFIMFTRLRLKILYKVKRTLNMSTTIIKMSQKLRIIYTIALIINCWTNVQTYEYARQYFVPVIQGISNRNEINEQTLLIIQLVMAALNFAIVTLVGNFFTLIFTSFDNNIIQIRAKNKLNNHKFKIQKSKLLPIKLMNTPLKTLFRTYRQDEQVSKDFKDQLQRLHTVVVVEEQNTNNQAQHRQQNDLSGKHMNAKSQI